MLDVGCLIFDCWRAPVAGGGIEIFNFAPRLRDASPHGRDALTRAFARIAHAKPRQEHGVEPQSPDTGRGADAERQGIQDVRMSEGENVVLRLEA
jgi:hypothetical protein